jgi:hypothetical protein
MLAGAVNYHALKDVACGSAKSRAAIGRLTSDLQSLTMLTHGAAIKTILPSDAKLIGLDLAAYESRSSIAVSIIPKLVLQQGVSKGPKITINRRIYEHKYFSGGAQFLHTLKDGALLGQRGEWIYLRGEGAGKKGSGGLHPKNCALS